MRSFIGAVFLLGCSDDPSPIEVDARVGGCSETIDACTGSTICIADACQPMFPRTYAVTTITAQIPNTNSNGMPWDTDGSGPDVWMLFEVSLARAAESAVMTNGFSPTFPGPYDLNLTDSSFVIISAMDRDDATDESLISCTLAGPQQVNDALRARRVSCTNGPFALSMRIAPK